MKRLHGSRPPEQTPGRMPLPGKSYYTAAMLLGRKLRWDPAREDFVGDEQASAMVARPQRAPYTIEV